MDKLCPESGEQVDLVQSAERKRIVVEVGSYNIPSAFYADRGIKENEHYVSLNKSCAQEIFDFTPNELISFKHEKRFTPMLGNAKSMPFHDGSVDEMIFNNVFGSYFENPSELASLFLDASRVLRSGGEIHITEMNTPNFIPDEWFLGGRPNKKSNKVVIANPTYFQQFGFICTKLSTKTKDIEYYRRRWKEYGTNKPRPFYDIAFTLTLRKV